MFLLRNTKRDPIPISIEKSETLLWQGECCTVEQILEFPPIGL